MTSDTSQETAVDQKLVGISGWLILPAIGFVLSLIITPINLIVQAVQTESDSAAYFIPSILVRTGLYIWLWTIAISFFKKRSTAPRSIIKFMVVRICALLLLFGLGFAVFSSDPSLGNELVIIGMLRSNNFIFQGIAAAIWIPYFKVSKRVKATFVK